LHRLSGQVALRRREPNRSCAESRFLQAIEVARIQETRLLELRATTDLDRLWQGTRAKGDIRALIAPILGQIEGGETAPNIRDVRALLAEPA
jgi:predicted ATPase